MDSLNEHVASLSKIFIESRVNSWSLCCLARCILAKQELRELLSETILAMQKCNVVQEKKSLILGKNMLLALYHM